MKWHSRKALILALERNSNELASLRTRIRQLSKDLQALRVALAHGGKKNE